MDKSSEFRSLHAPGEFLVLPNVWDGASAKIVEACGARALATTSSGLSWSCGYADGNHLPVDELVAAVRRIARAVAKPLSVDMEAGYSDDPPAVGANVARIVDAGAAGINLEDGTDPPSLLCAKIEAARRAAQAAGTDLFINARTDVYLRDLAPPEGALDETIARARRYAEAGCDGIFVPHMTDANDIAALAATVDLPLNVMLTPDLPPQGELRKLGVRRLSAGGSIAEAAYGLSRHAAARLLHGETPPELSTWMMSYAELNALMQN